MAQETDVSKIDFYTRQLNAAVTEILTEPTFYLPVGCGHDEIIESLSPGELIPRRIGIAERRCIAIWRRLACELVHTGVVLLHAIEPSHIQHSFSVSVEKGDAKTMSMPCVYPGVPRIDIAMLCGRLAHTMALWRIPPIRSVQTQYVIAVGSRALQENRVAAFHQLFTYALTLLYAYALFDQSICPVYESEHYSEENHAAAAALVQSWLSYPKYFCTLDPLDIREEFMKVSANVKTASLNMPGPDIVEIKFSTPGY